MQRATGQYDHLARVPGTGPRQSRGRRSFASRHWCRAAPRRSHGMGTTVRNPRIESAIGLEAARSSPLSRRFPNAGWSVAVPNTVLGLEPDYRVNGLSALVEILSSIPDGGRVTFDGRHGSMKPEGRRTIMARG